MDSLVSYDRNIIKINQSDLRQSRAIKMHCRVLKQKKLVNILTIDLVSLYCKGTCKVLNSGYTKRIFKSSKQEQWVSVIFLQEIWAKVMGF